MLDFSFRIASWQPLCGLSHYVIWIVPHFEVHIFLLIGKNSQNSIGPLVTLYTTWNDFATFCGFRLICKIENCAHEN